MASSEKAGALKDAFVNAIANELGEEAMAEAGAMENAKLAGKLGMKADGDQASLYVMLEPAHGSPHGALYGHNDGDDRFRINRGGMNYPRGRHDQNMYPHQGKPVGTKGVVRNLSQQEHGKYSRELNDFLDNERKLGYL